MFILTLYKTEIEAGEIDINQSLKEKVRKKDANGGDGNHTPTVAASDKRRRMNDGDHYKKMGSQSRAVCRVWSQCDKPKPFVAHGIPQRDKHYGEIIFVYVCRVWVMYERDKRIYFFIFLFLALF